LANTPTSLPAADKLGFGSKTGSRQPHLFI